MKLLHIQISSKVGQLKLVAISYTAILFYLVLLSVISLSGCGPTVKIAENFSDSAPKVYAALPPIFPEYTSRERQETVRSLLDTELKNHGLTLLDQQIVSKVCVDSNCSGKENLISKYNVDRFIRLTVRSASRTNLLAAYYNTLSGDLVIEDRNSQPILSVDHQESERGGLLFNSGQIVEGIRSSIKNAGDSSFNNLAQRFAHALVKEIPRKETDAPSNIEQSDVSIKSLSATQIKPEVYEVCAVAPPNVSASLILKRHRTPLREISSGKYCSIVRLDDSLSMASNLSVEVRSPFGSTARKELIGIAPLPCDTEGVFGQRLTNSNSVEISISCARIGGIYAPSSTSCSKTSSCDISKVVVYRGDGDLGPFEPIDEFKGLRWTAPRSATKSGSDIYEVVAVESSGSRSAPIRPANLDSIASTVVR